MNKPHLGMYVHMHWGYGHPYAARTWTVEDWRNYASGLKSLGYNTVMIWPMFETIPDPPTPSDVAHLEKISRTIDILHSEFDMSVLITLGPNTVGNEKAADYTFETRPFFDTDLRLNPGDPAQVERLISFRRKLMGYVGKADGFSVIDSDPGGYVGSTNDEFANLLGLHLDLIKEFNPGGKLFYWMWVGWEAYNEMWRKTLEGDLCPSMEAKREDFDAVISRLIERGGDDWGVFSCNGLHQEVVDGFGIQDRALFYPYGLVEGEPSFPFTNYSPDTISIVLGQYDVNKTQLGIMANSQTHAVQLPHTYLFAHQAQGGTMANADLDGFAEGLIVGLGALIADSWRTLWGGDSEKMRVLARGLAANASREQRLGPHGGLLFGDPGRFLTDLSLMLAFRADVIDLTAALDRGESPDCQLVALASSWREWQERTGFVDACGDAQGLFPGVLRRLNDPGIDAVLADFENWSDTSVRHGTLPRLIAAVDARAKRG